jgi:hypothetical protein
MIPRNAARLAIHRRADEMSFLQRRLRTLGDEALETAPDHNGLPVVERERDLADELLHTRHSEPLGETLQRRLVMAEHICRDLARPETDSPGPLSDAYWVAETERQALSDMLNQWWAWLHGS